MTDAIKKLFDLLIQKEKSGSDYTGKVTSVDGKTARVQFDGSDIVDTPVRMSVGASPGDSVRVRVADGKAWITGNDSAPPNDSAEAMKEIEATNAHITKIETENIVGENGWINLKEGKFSYGGDALSWNGKILKVKGNIQADSGEIGGWGIDHDGITQTWKEDDSGYTKEYTSLVYPERAKFEYVYRDNEDVPVNKFSSGISYAQVIAEQYSYNDDGTVNHHYQSYMTGRNIMENGTLLSNKYAPISNSDPVLKKNIAKSSMNAIALLKRITMHAFDWRSNGKHWDVGFIAPELHEIDPNMADPPTGEHGSYWNVNSFYMVGVLTKAVQELTERVEALEKEITHE